MNGRRSQLGTVDALLGRDENGNLPPRLNPEAERTLVTRIRADDMAALDELMAHEMVTIMAEAGKLSAGDDDLRWELFMRAYVHLVEVLTRVLEPGRSAQAFIRTTARNRMLDALRRLRAIPEDELITTEAELWGGNAPAVPGEERSPLSPADNGPRAEWAQRTIIAVLEGRIAPETMTPEERELIEAWWNTEAEASTKRDEAERLLIEGGLTDRQEIAIALRLGLGGVAPRSYEKIGVAMGCSSGSAHGLVQRGLATLKRTTLQGRESSRK